MSSDTITDNKQHKETLNLHKLHILQRMASYASFNRTNEIPLSILRDEINDYNNAQKLRYHALVFKVKRGSWGVTKHAVSFLRGEKALPEWVLIEDNKIVDRSENMITISDLIGKDTSVKNTFDYYKNGVYIGERPGV